DRSRFWSRPPNFGLASYCEELPAPDRDGLSVGILAVERRDLRVRQDDIMLTDRRSVHFMSPDSSWHRSTDEAASAEPYKRFAAVESQGQPTRSHGPACGPRTCFAQSVLT